MKDIKGVGFDLFNTLITVESHALDHAVSSLSRALQQEGLAVEPKAFQEMHRQAARQHIAETRRDGRETHNRFWISTALHQLGWEVGPYDPRIARAVEVYFAAFIEFCHLIPGTGEMLDALRKRYRLGLLSNFTHPPAARAILDALGLTPCFEVVLISGELGYRKPHASVFQLLVEKLGVAPAHLLYVGDDPEPDIDGACSAGLRPVWTTYVRDRRLPLAPGMAAEQLEGPQCKAPRISSWRELLALLGVKAGDGSSSHLPKDNGHAF